MECEEVLKITCGNHAFIINDDLKGRLERLNSVGGRALLQIPEGFKTCSVSLISSLSGLYPNVEFVIDVNPSYGSCVMDLSLVSEFDTVVHFGHSEYPLWTPPSNVFFAEVIYLPRLSEHLVSEAVGTLKKLHAESALIYTTQQHLRQVSVLASAMEEARIAVLNSEKLAFGCIYPQFRWDADAVVILAGGLFHVIGAGLACRGLKHVVQVDPYRNSVSVRDPDVKRWIKTRLWKASEASYSRLGREWLIVAGMCGQYRADLLRELTSALDDAGQPYVICRSLFFTRDSLLNVDTPSIGSIIVTSCPRIAVDDLGNYHKPVLTPGEALYALGYHEVYTFPW